MAVRLAEDAARVPRRHRRGPRGRHRDRRGALRREVAFGSGEGRVAVVNRNGQPISLDKYLRRVVAFDTRSREQLEPMLDAIDEVLAALQRGRGRGVPGLRHAARRGPRRQVIGNDSDADLGYVSHHTAPRRRDPRVVPDPARAVGLGYRITRYSGARVQGRRRGGRRHVRGLDVFGGFLLDGHLHLMGEIREPFEKSWIFPLGTTTLEGRDLPGPGRPRPAARGDVRRVLAGARPGLPLRAAGHDGAAGSTAGSAACACGRARWDRIYSRLRGLAGPSPFIEWAAGGAGAGTYVDVGCGRGADVLFMAGRGEPSVGLDFQPRRSPRRGGGPRTTPRDFWR